MSDDWPGRWEQAQIDAYHGEAGAGIANVEGSLYLVGRKADGEWLVCDDMPQHLENRP